LGQKHSSLAGLAGASWEPILDQMVVSFQGCQAGFGKMISGQPETVTI